MKSLIDMANPIVGPLKILFDLKVEMGSFSANVRENSRRLRAKMTKYI